MNKRQREKQAKKLRAVTIEVGDTVEIIYNSFGGFPVGTIGKVVPVDAEHYESLSAFGKKTTVAISSKYSRYRYNYVHNINDLKLIQKGRNK